MKTMRTSSKDNLSLWTKNNAHELAIRKAIWRKNPQRYAREVLQVNLTPKQSEILESLRDNPRTMVMSHNGLGKSFVCAVALNWAIDCFDEMKVISTAPNERQVKDIIWGEFRRLRGNRIDGLKPAAPEIYLSPTLWAKGFTGRGEAAFQGVHAENLIIIMDEAVGIDKVFWEAAKSMTTDPSSGNKILVIFNPTDITSEAYRQYQSGGWHVIQASAMDHPNVISQLAGGGIIYKGAATVEFIKDMLADEAERLMPGMEEPEIDVEFPPGSGDWYRPNGVFEARVLGRWPRASSSAVWSMESWERALTPQEEDVDAELILGCDVARFGDDYTEVFLRRGKTAIYWNRWGKTPTNFTALRIMDILKDFARPGEDLRMIQCIIDDSGVGGGVTDYLQGEGYNAVPVVAQNKALNEQKYPDRRSELWFDAAHAARKGDVDISRLPRECQDYLQEQLFSATWEQDKSGRRAVLSKKKMKGKMKRSPDTADAFNLCWAQGDSVRGWDQTEIPVGWTTGEIETPDDMAFVFDDGLCRAPGNFWFGLNSRNNRVKSRTLWDTLR